MRTHTGEKQYSYDYWEKNIVNLQNHMVGSEEQDIIQNMTEMVGSEEQDIIQNMTEMVGSEDQDIIQNMTEMVGSEEQDGNRDSFILNQDEDNISMNQIVAEDSVEPQSDARIDQDQFDPRIKNDLDEESKDIIEDHYTEDYDHDHCKLEDDYEPNSDDETRRATLEYYNDIDFDSFGN